MERLAEFASIRLYLEERMTARAGHAVFTDSICAFETGGYPGACAFCSILERQYRSDRTDLSCGTTGSGASSMRVHGRCLPIKGSFPASTSISSNGFCRNAGIFPTKKRSIRSLGPRSAGRPHTGSQRVPARADSCCHADMDHCQAQSGQYGRFPNHRTDIQSNFLRH